MVRRKQRAAAVGVTEHGNSAVLVTVAPGGELLDRRRIDLTERGLPALPHHHEGSWAVGRYLNTPGARPLSLADVVALVERVRASAARGARVSLEALAVAVPVPIERIAIRVCPKLPPTTEERIADNRAQTYADSVMYREALASAAEARGWSVHWYERERVFRDAAAVLGRADIDELLRAMGRSIGPPWQARHKLAAAAAIAATRRARRGQSKERVTVVPGDLDDPRVRALLELHARTARAATAPGSAHALDIGGLKAPDITLWAAWDEDELLAVGALKRLSNDHGEIKSMHTAASHRRRGVGAAMLQHIVDAARTLGMSRLSLETGSWDYFVPARELYRRHGFVDCLPFGGYRPDPNSVFMTRDLR